MLVEVVIIGIVGVGFPLLLYVLIQEETSNPEIIDRSEAERVAQQRGGRPDGSHTEHAEERDEWGTGGEWGDTSEQE